MPSGSPLWNATTRTPPGPSLVAFSLNWSGMLSPDAGTVSVPRSSSVASSKPARGWTRTSIVSPGPTSAPSPIPCAVGAWTAM